MPYGMAKIQGLADTLFVRVFCYKALLYFNVLLHYFRPVDVFQIADCILVGNKVDEIETNVFRVPSRINSTWGGNLVDMVRSTQILQIVEEDQLCENAEKVGTYLRDNLESLSHRFDQMTNVRGRGLLCSFDFPTKEMRNAFIGKGLENNVMFLGCGEKTIRFRPALCIEQKHIDEGLTVMEKILPLL